MLKIRRPLGRLIFNMGIAIPGKTVFLIETAPWSTACIFLIHDRNVAFVLHLIVAIESEPYLLSQVYILGLEQNGSHCVYGILKYISTEENVHILTKRMSISKTMSSKAISSRKFCDKFRSYIVTYHHIDDVIDQRCFPEGMTASARQTIIKYIAVIIQWRMFACFDPGSFSILPRIWCMRMWLFLSTFSLAYFSVLEKKQRLIESSRQRLIGAKSPMENTFHELYTQFALCRVVWLSTSLHTHTIQIYFSVCMHWQWSYRTMMTSSNENIFWPFVRGIHRSPVNSPHKGQWRGALMFTLIWARINGWVNSREAGDLRRHRAHYDVIAMRLLHCQCIHIEECG